MTDDNDSSRKPYVLQQIFIFFISLRLPYNLYCVGGDVNTNQPTFRHRISIRAVSVKLCHMIDVWLNATPKIWRLFPKKFVYENHGKIWCDFYRAMHFSAKRGIAIAGRLSVCDVGEL